MPDAVRTTTSAAGRGEPDPGERRKPVEAGHREVEQDDVRLERAGRGDRLLAVAGPPDDPELVALEQRRQRVARQRMVVDDQDAIGHTGLIGGRRPAD